MKYRFEFLVAFIFHLVLIFFLAIRFNLEPEIGTTEPIAPIQAVMFDEAEIEQQIEAFNQQPEIETQKNEPVFIPLPVVNSKKIEEEQAKQKAEEAKQALIRLAELETQQRQKEENARLAARDEENIFAQQQAEAAEKIRLAQQEMERQQEIENDLLAEYEEAQQIKVEQIAREEEIKERAALKQQEEEKKALEETLEVIKKEVALLAEKEKQAADLQLAEAKHQQVLAEKKQQEQVEKRKQQKIREQADLAEQQKQQALRIKKQAQVKKDAEKKEATRLANVKQQKKQAAARLAKIKQSANKTEEKKRLKESIAADMASRGSSSETNKREDKRKELAKKTAREKSAQEKIKREKYQQAENKEASAATEDAQRQTQQIAAARQVKIEQDISKFTRNLQRVLKAGWVRPISMSQGLACVIRVKLISTGKVTQATIEKSSGDSFFDRSALNAVHKASPLPIPSDKALFEEQFKSFTFTFRPE
ncbi:MAG: cell envelope integrity protein TolA [Methylococcales bacterium]|nr:cell envelope integrity protein TolA [Methylococcales bacterium]